MPIFRQFSASRERNRKKRFPAILTICLSLSAGLTVSYGYHNLGGGRTLKQGTKCLEDRD